jgi:hypothetical protein
MKKIRLSKKMLLQRLSLTLSFYSSSKFNFYHVKRGHWICVLSYVGDVTVDNICFEILSLFHGTGAHHGFLDGIIKFSLDFHENFVLSVLKFRLIIKLESWLLLCVILFCFIQFVSIQTPLPLHKLLRLNCLSFWKWK